VKGIWLVIRMLGFVLVNMIHFGIGPDFIIGELTGGFVMSGLLPTLLAVFLLASLLLSLLIDYGLLDFFGAQLIRIMRPVFNLPGRSALNCIASWLGDGSIGVLMTSKQYEEGFYSKREAAVVATTFSAVSITFCLAVISQVGLPHMFLPSVIGASIKSEMTRFVVAATSVTQLIYMSEIGSIIMGSKVPVSFWKLFVIFLERTVVTLPIIALFAHLLF